MSHLARRLEGIPPTIFTTMSALALRTGAVNLGQGFPDADGPQSVLGAARDAISAGANHCARRSRGTSSATTRSSSTPTVRWW